MKQGAYLNCDTSVIDKQVKAVFFLRERLGQIEYALLGSDIARERDDGSFAFGRLIQLSNLLELFFTTSGDVDLRMISWCLFMQVDTYLCSVRRQGMGDHKTNTCRASCLNRARRR